MILNKDRMRVFTRQWRYLILSGAMIAVVSVVMISSRAGKIAAQPATINNDNQILIAMVRQVAEGIPRQIYFGGSSPNPYLKFKDFTGVMGEPMWRKFDGFVRQNLTVTRVQVDDFDVRINDAEATVDFLGTIYFKTPVQGREESVADRYRVEMVKANGQWQADSPPPPPPPPTKPVAGVRNDAPPPPPPPPQERAEEQTLLALIQDAVDANIKRDTSVFERLLADDYIGTGPNGEVTNKAQDIAEIKRQDITITKGEIDDFRVRIDGNSAIANFLGTVFFTANGEDSTVQYRYTCSFVKRSGRWQILAIHMSRKQ